MERSDERLSTRDIASPSSGADTAETDTAPERDARVADPPPADTAAVPDDRADRDFDGGGGGAVAADRAEPVGDGDVMTEAPAEGRGASRESVADAEAGATGGDAGTRDTGAAGDSAGTAAAAAGTSDVATRADPGADSRDTQR